MGERVRAWVAKSQFEGLAEFYFGTVFASTEMEAHVEFVKAWRAVMPLDPPSRVTLLPGAIILNLGGGE